jgi:hypothetical protein
MIPMTPQRTPVVVTDPMEQFLLEHAEPTLTAPEIPLIVLERCNGNLGEFMTFWSLSHLATMHQTSGRKDFTVAEIARYAKGISRGRITTYLRGLCDKALIEVVGHRETPGHNREHWTALYHIDRDRLRHESMPVAVAHLRSENQPAPLRVKAAPGQIALDLPSQDDRPAGDDGNGTGGRPQPPEDAGGAPQGGRASHRAPTPIILGVQRQRRSAAVPRQGADTLHPTMQTRAPSRTLAPNDAYLAPEDADTLHPTMQTTGLDGADHTREGQYLAPEDAVVGGWVGKEVGKEVGESERAAPATALAVTHLDSIRAIVQEEIGQSIREEIGQALRAHLAARTSEAVPPPPPDEPAVDAGPRATWAALTGHDLTGRDVAQIAEHIRRCDAPSGGHGAYWLTRAMVTASLSEKTPLTLSYADGILRRMARQGTWSTAELVRQPHETLREAAAPPTARPAEAAQVARGKPRPPQAAPAAPSGPEHPAITAYTAAFGKKLTDAVQRQLITATVTNLEAWQKVLTDWRANGWTATAVAKMIDRYQKEMGTAPAASEAPLTSARIADHPDLTPEERSGWMTRFRHATTTADKQAVMNRFLKEHPTHV